MSVLSSLIQKEVTQLRRNPFLSKLVFAFPIVVMLIIPWVTTMDVRHVGVGIVDSDGSSLSRQVISKVDASPYFDLVSVDQDYREELELLDGGKLDVILEIPSGYEKSILEGSPKKLSISANAVNATKGSIGAQYLSGTVLSAIGDGRSGPAITISVRNLYNPTLEYRNFMIPAIIIILLLLLGGFLPALSIVSEKETGTIEQINVTPVRQSTFILAKLIPWWVIGFIDVFLAMGVAWLVYGLWPVGTLGAIYLGALLFIVTMSGFGVMAANVTQNMIQTIFVMFFFVMIFMLMSGLLTPVSSMPQWAQTITYVLPPRYFANILRSVYLKGATVPDLWKDYVALAALALVFVAGAVLTYKKQK